MVNSQLSFLVDISYLTIRKSALETILLNQRLRQGLRQRLRSVSMASAACQQGRRRLFCDDLDNYVFMQMSFYL